MLITKIKSKVFLILRATFNVNILPLVIYHLVVAVIIIKNIKVGHYFLGWDSLHPEFDFALNLKRALIGSWQENYGLGTLGGHGFSALLPHVLITWFMSFVIPNWAIRQAFAFVCLYFGGLGIYFLFKHLTKSFFESHHLSTFRLNFVSLLVSLFYILNLGTIQTFYVMLEAFVVPFALIPWIMMSLFDVLENPRKSTLIRFFVLNFILSIQGFIPPLFMVYISVLLLVFLAFLLKTAVIGLRERFKRIFAVSILVLVSNLYWLTTFSYYALFRSQNFGLAYNNLINTSKFVDVNKKYGNIKDAALLKGYLFDSYQLGDYILAPYSTHYSKAAVTLIGYVCFAISLVGVVYVMVKGRNYMVVSLGLVYILFLSLFLTNTPPFSFLYDLVGKVFPILKQVFRTPFTRASIGFSFSVSIFYGFGIFVLLSALEKLRFRISEFFVLSLLLVCQVIYSLPVFKGNLFYKKLLVSIPQSYFQLMNDTKKLDGGRIAEFPLDCSEGWYFLKWNYFGSGFMNYGISSPIMSRSYDIWNKDNENYYWEASQALREGNYSKMRKIFEKYNVKYLLFDENSKHCSNSAGFVNNYEFLDEIKNSIGYGLLNTYSDVNSKPIRLFKVLGDEKSSSIELTSKFPNVGPRYEYSDYDSVFQKEGDYITNESKDPDAYFPYREIFSKRMSLEEGRLVRHEEGYLVFEANISQGSLKSDSKVYIPPYKDFVKYLPVKVAFERQTLGGYKIYLRPILPEVYLNNSTLLHDDTEFLIGSVSTDISNISLVINYKKVDIDKETLISYGFLYTGDTNVVSIENSSTGNIISRWQDTGDDTYDVWLAKSNELNLSNVEQNGGINQIVRVKIPVKPEEVISQATFGSNQKTYVVPCGSTSRLDANKYEVGVDYMRMIVKDSEQCYYKYIPELYTDSAFLMQIDAKHLSGNPLKVKIQDGDRVVDLLEATLRPLKYTTSYSFVVPPVYKTNKGYVLVIENSSKSQLSINDIYDISFFPFPIELFKKLYISSSADHSTEKVPFYDKITVNHPNPAYYYVSNFQTKDGYLTLSQGFDTLWKAYRVNDSYLSKMLPFIGGKELKDHFVVNNWKNGWELDLGGTTSTGVVIVNITQYFQYLSYIIQTVFFALLVFRKERV